MDFKIQDILKNLIPGLMLALIIFVIGIVAGSFKFPVVVPGSIKDLSNVVFIIFLAVIYVIGYLIDTISSLSEKYVLYRVVAKPSFKLLNNTTTNYRIENLSDVVENLCRSQNRASARTYDKDACVSLFKTANILKDKNQSGVIKDKVAEYYNAYIFSRNLMLVFILSFIVCIFLAFGNYFNVGNLVLIITLSILVVIGIYRWRSRAYYYSRQVFYASLY